jgi:hypothetical protein
LEEYITLIFRAEEEGNKQPAGIRQSELRMEILDQTQAGEGVHTEQTGERGRGLLLILVLSGLPFRPTPELGFPQWLILLVACLAYPLTLKMDQYISLKCWQTSMSSLNTETPNTPFTSGFKWDKKKYSLNV